MHDNLKPTPENINKDKFGQIPKSEFVPSEPLPMSRFLVEFEAKIHEQLEENISGTITQIALENGIKYEYAVNKSFVVEALKKATARKPIDQGEQKASGLLGMMWLNNGKCPNCFNKVVECDNFCGECGQKLDWSEEYE